jgi:hypothetical protein
MFKQQKQQDLVSRVGVDVLARLPLAMPQPDTLQECLSSEALTGSAL